MPTQVFSAQFENLDPIRDFVAAAARQAGMDEKAVYNAQLAVDEACSNIIEHAYEGVPDGRIEVSTISTRGAFKVALRDWGKTFDPSTVADPDTRASLEERQVGGLGLFFMRKLMDRVEYRDDSEQGNLLVLTKFLSPASSVRQRPNWQDLLRLGEHILSLTTLAQQRDLLLDTASTLVDGQVSLWLNENSFRLPNWLESLFSPEPPTEMMRFAHETGETVRQQANEDFIVAVPLHHEETRLGVLEIRRPNGKKFTRRDLGFLEGLARTASIALIAWHRITVERWRIGQLELVRTVSEQIANEHDLDDLSQRVTRLIQSTFKFYYVAIFTLEKEQASLDFRSSVGGVTRRRGRPRSLAFSAELGQGLVGSAAQTGQEILSNDVRSEPRFRHLESLSETRSELAIPLKFEERVVGVLDIQSDQLNAFHPYDLLVLRALADNIAVAVESTHLYSDLRRQADQMRAVAEVSKQIASILNLRDLMQEVATLLHQRFEYPHVHLFTVHPNRRQIHYEAGSGARSAALEGYVIDLDDPDGLIPWVARNGHPVLANDVEKEPRYRPSPLPPANTRSEITIPLIFNGQVYGVLDVQSDRLNAFGAQDQMLFEALGDIIAVAVRNADLYRAEQWRRQVGDSLREVAVLLSANASLDQVLDAILTELERNLPSDVASIWLLDEDDIYCAAVHGARALDLERARMEHPEASAYLTTALLARQPVIRKLGDPLGPSALAHGFGPEHSAIAVPLRIGEQAVGVLTLVHHTSGRYGHEAHTMATTFASYAAVSIENARLYDSAQEQAYASAALLQVAQAVVSLSDLDEILGTIVRIMPILVGVERAAVYRWDAANELFQPTQAYGLPEEARPHVWRPLAPQEFPLLQTALDQAQTVLCQEAHLGPENWLEIRPCPPDRVEQAVQSDDRLLVALPLMVKGEIFGVLLVEEAVGGRRFRSRRLEILNGIAQQIALSIQNDLFQKEMVARERLETEIQLAQQIQTTFLPDKLPTIPGWDLSARWRTARQMGGDFYDVIELPDGRVGLFIADVADKGVPAAMFMALTRTLVRAAVLQTDSPAAALRQVNDLLYPDCQQGMFVTAVYGVLDIQTAEFTYANAGHNPPLVLHAGEVIERLTRTGIALGAVENPEMTQRSIQLAVGSALIFYTDGITEAFSPTGEEFGEERLIKVLTTSKASTARALLEAIDRRVDKFLAGDPPADDMTLLAVKRLALP